MSPLEESIYLGLVRLSEDSPDADRRMFVFPVRGTMRPRQVFEECCEVMESGPVTLVCSLPEALAVA